MVAESTNCTPPTSSRSQNNQYRSSNAIYLDIKISILPPSCVQQSNSDAKEETYSEDTLEDHLEDMYEVGGSEPELVWVGDKELEDTWEKDDLARLAEEHWPRADGNDWEEIHFQSVDGAEKPSDEIVDTIRSGCAQNIQDCPSVTKPNIGLKMGRLDDVEHPTEIVDIMEHVHEYCSQN